MKFSFNSLISIFRSNELTNSDSFFQVDTLKGYKYIDLAGEIVNLYHTEDSKPPRFEMNLQGLTIKSPKGENSLTLKVTPNTIWAGFKAHTTTQDRMFTTFGDYVTEVSEILSVTTYKRIGWRNYFIYKLQDDNIDNWFPLDKAKKDKHVKTLNTINMRIDVEIDGTKLLGNLILEPLVKEGGEEKGVLCDLDLYTEGSFSKDEIQGVFKAMKKYLKEGGYFVTLLNELFGN